MKGKLMKKDLNIIIWGVWAQRLFTKVRHACGVK